MEIKDVTGIPRIQGRQARSGTGPDNAAKGAQGAKDEVRISPEARRNAETDGNAGRLEDLKRRIKAGVYKPDIRQVALNLINNELAPLL